MRCALLALVTYVFGNCFFLFSCSFAVATRCRRGARSTSLAEAVNPSPRRADQSSRRRQRGLARAASQPYEGPLSLSRTTAILDNVAGWILELDPGSGMPFKGLFVLARGSRRWQSGGTHGEQAPAGDGARARVGSSRARGAGNRKARPRINGLRTMLKADVAEQEKNFLNHYPPGRGLVTRCRAQGGWRSVWRQSALRQLNFAVAAGRNRESSAPTARANHAVQAHHQSKNQPGKFKVGET